MPEIPEGVEVWADPFQDLDRLLRHRIRAEDIPLKAIGGNVLLRRVRQDSRILILLQMDHRVLQIGEVIGLGSRWTQDSVWNPPISIQGQKELMHSEKGRLLDGTLDKDWKPRWCEERPRVRPSIFTPAHEALLGELHPGDLVVFNQARTYSTFRWGDDDLLVYPGNWILGVIDKGHLAEHPELRRYEKEPQ